MRMDDLAAMTKLSRRALEYADLDTLFGEAVALLAGALRAKYCTVLELLPDGDALLLRAGVGWRDGLVGHATVPAASESQGGYTLLRSEPVVIEDLATETRFRAPSLLTDHGVVSGMSVVIEGKDTPFGVLSLHTSVQRTFTEDDVRLLSLTANLLSTAIRHFADQRALRDEREHLTNAQRIGHLGSWDNNYSTNTLEWSDEVYRIFGVAPQEFGATEDAFIAAVHPDDRLRVIDAISASVTERRPYDIQHRIVRRDGSVRTVHGQGEVTFESDGTPSHILGTVLDITDRVEAERTVAESEERLRAIVDTVRSGIVITDEQGAIRFTNRACEEMFGYSPGELTRLNADVMIPESEREHARARSAAMLRGEEVQSRFRAQRVRKDGSAIYVDVGTSVVSLPGEPDGILVELRDVTEEVQLQAQLLQVQKSEALGTLVAGVAHDFNNLLTSILGGIELARRRPDQAERWLVKAQRAAERSAQLVQQLVTFSRPSQHDTAPIDTTETVREAVAMARDTFDRRIQISFEVVEELPPVLGNHGELVQVVMNLLLNARDAVSERLEKGDDERYDPMIGITVDAAPGSGAIATHVRLVVQDNGVGMSEDVRARAFDPFFSTKEIGKGTGLAIVYRIIRDQRALRSSCTPSRVAARPSQSGCPPRAERARRASKAASPTNGGSGVTARCSSSTTTQRCSSSSMSRSWVSAATWW